MSADGTLRILSFGAGAIGAYIGGSLALQGHPVTFIERPEAAAELRRNGLLLQIGENTHAFPAPRVAGSLAEALALGSYDVGLFALKSYDTPAALHEMTPLADGLPPILCLQNGVDNEPAIAAVLGDEKVIPGTVTTAVSRLGVGQIAVEKLRGVGLAGNHPLSARLLAALNQAGLHARLYPRPLDMKWSKMLSNLLANATSAILEMPPAQVFSHPGLYRIEIAQLRETLSVMNAQGIQVVALPRTPIHLLAWAVRSLPVGLTRPVIGRAVGGGRGAKMPSFYIDLESGRGKTEVGYLNGAVARAGEKTHLPTPTNHLLNDLLQRITDGLEPRLGWVHQPERLVQAWLHASVSPFDQTTIP
jgi:2-dehydropantoate 2-reductase